MAEYIDREDVYNTMKAMYCDECTDEKCQMCEYAKIMFVLDNLPAADVKPVKRGYWIKQPEKFQIHEDVINSNYLYSCSCCNASDLHSERANNDGEVKFCWRCGAKMDAEPDEPWQSK